MRAKSYFPTPSIFQLTTENQMLEHITAHPHLIVLPPGDVCTGNSQMDCRDCVTDAARRMIEVAGFEASIYFCQTYNKLYVRPQFAHFKKRG